MLACDCWSGARGGHPRTPARACLIECSEGFPEEFGKAPLPALR